jgi:hypothetical protein
MDPRAMRREACLVAIEQRRMSLPCRNLTFRVRRRTFQSGQFSFLRCHSPFRQRAARDHTHFVAPSSLHWLSFATLNQALLFS